MASNIPCGPIRSMLQLHFSFEIVQEIIGYTGIDMVRIAQLERESPNGGTIQHLLSAVDQQLGEADDTKATKIVAICCEEILRKAWWDIRDELDHVLSRVGWQFIQGNLVPIEVFDASELQQLPSQAHEDLIKAAVRLRDGDLSGALSSCCSAIDSVTNTIYRNQNIVNSGNASFQEKVKKSLEALSVQSKLAEELDRLGWDRTKITLFKKNLIGSLHQAAYVMQTLRSNMGDVHGTKPVLTALVYDSLKWSTLLLRFLSAQ